MGKNKENNIISITIGLMSFLLICIMFMQFKVVNETDVTEIESMREDELQEALLDWKTRYKETQLKLDTTNEMIKEYQEKAENSADTSKLVQKELEESRLIAGKTNVIGTGIQVTLTDNKSQIYSEKDLLNLVNELRAAGAEAISINGERITTLTDIVYISDRYILINSSKVSSPYIVTAIGDQNYLKSALNIKNGYVDIKQKEGYNILVEEKSNIKMNAYSRDFNLKYIEM